MLSLFSLLFLKCATMCVGTVEANLSGDDDILGGAGRTDEEPDLCCDISAECSAELFLL